MAPTTTLKFSALSCPARAQLFCLVAQGETRVAELVEKCEELSSSSVSQHLSTLRNAGLVARRKEGRFAFYSVNAEGVEEIIAALTRLKAA